MEFKGSKTEAKTTKVYLGKYTLTAYCPCRSCSGGHGSNTASGKKAKQGRTIAVDTRKIKLGTKIHINGHTFDIFDMVLISENPNPRYNTGK